MENSQLFINQAATSHNINVRSGNNDRVDLTLKLGLPDCSNNNNNPVATSSFMASNHLANLGFSGHNTQEMNQLRMVNHEALGQAGRLSFNGSQYAWPSDHQIASNYVHNMNYTNGFNQFSGPSLGLPSYNTNSYNNLQPAPSPSLCLPSYNTNSYNNLLPVPTMVPTNCYTLLDVPSRRAAIQNQRELGSSSSGTSGSNSSGIGKRSQRRQRGGNYHDPNKRCTNYNCNTNNTPMWRKGPLGPKTLCNACGIKYRKEDEKRKTREATSIGHQQSNPNG